ncbi:LysR family transcriptional regulator [Burkholderia sp. 3C]
MLTFKQMEALYWIVKLGSFEAAAARLNTTQSAISKRVQELERAFDIAVFDRANRSARLTEKGSEFFDYAQALLEQRDRVVERISSKTSLVRQIRIGVTELTALTWLPRLIAAIQAEYPKVTVEAEVDLNATLRERLAAGTVDVIIVPQTHEVEAFSATLVGHVENAWMCAAHLAPRKRRIALADIAQFQLILQGGLSGTGHVYSRFLETQGVALQKTLASSSLIAQIGLALSGLGITYLPRACLSRMLEQGALVEVVTTPALPPIRYLAMHRGDEPHTLSAAVAKLAAQSCDFTSNLLDPGK